jgi:hypothetical protein
MSRQELDEKTIQAFDIDPHLDREENRRPCSPCRVRSAFRDLSLPEGSVNGVAAYIVSDG